MSEMEQRAKTEIGLDIHFGVYLRSKSVDRSISHQESFKLICKALNVTEEEMKSKDKKGDVVLRRKVFAAVMRASFPSITLVNLGQMLERDHTTIINLLSKATDLVNAEDPEFKHLFHLATKAISL